MAKYLFIAKNTVPLSNPAGLIIYRIAKVLSDLNHSVQVYSLEDPSKEQYIPAWLTDGDQVSVKRIDTTKYNKFIIYAKFIYTLILNISSEIKKNDRVYIVTHTNPLYCHWFGLIIKILFFRRIKWIASFTDPYVRSPFTGYAKFTFGSFIRGVEQSLVFRFSEKMIFVTEAMRNYNCGNNRRVISKSIVIPFFYLREWELKIRGVTKPSLNDNRVVIIHAGAVYGNRDISKFLSSVSKYNNSIFFQNIGHVKGRFENISCNVKISDSLPYDEMLFNLKQADYVLIIDSFFSDMKNPYMPSKVVDAMLLDKPIIGITEADTELDIFLRKTGNISIPNDERVIDELLSTLTKNKHKTDYSSYVDSNIKLKFEQLNF